MQYLPYCEGQVRQTTFKNNTAYRGILAWDGQQQGYSVSPSNYASLNIDEMPLGEQQVIHFPERYAMVDLEATESCIHLVLDGRYARSCDGGSTFNDIDAFSGNMNEQVIFIDFVNDTLGFLVSRNLITEEWKLWKTTNGGGSILAPILTNEFIGGLSIVEFKTPPTFQVFPNPSNGSFKIQSKKTMGRVEIYSIIGEILASRMLQKNEETIDLSSCEAGVYFVRVFTENGFADQRLVLAK